MIIKPDDLAAPEIASFLEQHILDMAAITPPESMHALNLDELRQADIYFWTAWEEERLIATGAIKLLDPTHGEIKSMRTCLSVRGQGVASDMLNYMMQQAVVMGLKRLSLETGSKDFFLPARKLYEKFGFEYCEPFADYWADPLSVFMTRQL